MKIRRKTKKGFTLVELVVVIAVIAILAAVSVGAYFGITDSANSSNATQGAKQIKDLWTIYSVSDEFDNNRSTREIAEDFCLSYAALNGPDYDVNFEIVEITSKNTDVNSLNGDEANNEAILFKVETTYPTWFITNGVYIVEEGAPSKSNKDFNSSLLTSRIVFSNKQIENLMSEDYVHQFEIETYIDSNGTKYRGYFNYEVEVENSPHHNAIDGKHKFYVKPGQSIIDATNFYRRAAVEVENSNLSWEQFDLKETETGISVESARILDLEKKIPRLIAGEKYSYAINDLYKLTYIEKAPVNLQEPTLNDYPIAVVTFEGTKEEIGSPKKSAKTIYDQGGKSTTTLSAGTTYEWRIYSYTVSQDYFVGSQKISFYSGLTNEVIQKINNNKTGTAFIFIKDAIINTKVEFTSNVIVALDFMTNSINDIQNYIEENSSSIYSEVKEYRTNKIYGAPKHSILWSYYDYTGKGPNDIAESEYLLADSYESHGYVDLNNISSNHLRYANSDDKTLKNYKTPYNRKPSSSDAVKSKLTITSSGSLTLNNKSSLIVEGFVIPASGTGPAGIGDRAEIINYGKINLNNSNLKVMGLISGSGEINAKGNSQIIEYLTVVDVIGGSMTAAVFTAGLFPFMEYFLDHIGCKLNLHYGVGYGFVGAVNVQDTHYPIPRADVLNSSHTEKSLFSFVKENDFEDDMIFASKEFVDSYDLIDDTLLTQHGYVDIQLYNKIVDGDVNVKVSSYNLNTFDRNFPISNMNVVINDGCVFEMGTVSNNKCAKFDFLPNSKLSINQGGTLLVKNTAQVAFISPQDISIALSNMAPSTEVLTRPYYEYLASLSGLQFINNGIVNVESTAGIYANTYEGSDDIIAKLNNLNGNTEDKIVNSYVNDGTNTYSYNYISGVSAPVLGSSRTIKINQYK